MAIKLNTGDAISLLRQTLQKEEEMFGWLRANAPTWIYITTELIKMKAMKVVKEYKNTSINSDCF